MKRAMILVMLLAFLFSACRAGGGTGTPTAGPDAAGVEPTVRETRYAEDGRIILTIGAFQTNSALQGENDSAAYTQLQKAVRQFNAQNGEYLAEIRNYGDAAGADALYALNAEILAGDMPDLLVTCGMPWESYAKKGLLLDLYAWYDREPFFAGPLRSMETDGKLYRVSPSVQIVTFYGLASVLGRAEGYGLEDLYAAWECFHTGENAFSPYFSAENAFLLLAGMRLEEWVDRSAAVCRFDSPEFLSLLEFCQKLPGDARITQSQAYAQGNLNYEEMCALCVKNRDAMLGYLFLRGEAGSVLGQCAANLTPLEGEDYVFTGIPGTLPSAAGCVSELPLAVSARSGNREGAKQFLDSLWDLRYRQVYENELRSVPLMRSVLEDYIRFYGEYNTRTYTDEEGRAYSALYIGPNTMPVTDAFLRDFLALIEGASAPVSPESASLSGIDPIIAEEAAAFFSGSQSAEKTAKNIQSRYSVYLEEQKQAG